MCLQKKVVVKFISLCCFVGALLGGYLLLTRDKSESMASDIVYFTLTNAQSNNKSIMTPSSSGVRSTNGNIYYWLCTNDDDETTIEKGSVKFNTDGSWVYKQSNSSDISGNGTYDLQQIFQKNKSSNLLKVKFCNGTYKVMNLFRIYSNTKIWGESKEDTILLKQNSTPIFITFDDSVAYKTKYYGTSNIWLHHMTVECLDSTVSPNKMYAASLLYAAHGSNFNITNVNVQNGGSGHTLQLTGIKDVLISGCSFSNLDYSISSDGTYTRMDNSYCINNKLKENSSDLKREVIQIESDFVTSSGSYSCPTMKMTNDNTPCNGVTVNNCSFSYVIRAIGNHSDESTQYQQNIKITNNTFVATRATILSFPKYKNISITNNKFKYNSSSSVGGYIIHVYKSVNSSNQNYKTIESSIADKWRSENYYWSGTLNSYQLLSNLSTNEDKIEIDN